MAAFEVITALQKSREYRENNAVSMTQLTCDTDGGMNTNGTRRGCLRLVTSGLVEDDPKKPGYIGAPGHTNNTGEMTALWVALSNASRRPAGEGREEIHTDSLYAMNMTTGKWMPKVKRNVAIVDALRELWRKIRRRRPGEVRLVHVRSHTRVPGNELADHLADGAAKGDRMTTEQAETWLQEMMHRWDEPPRPPRSGPSRTES